MKVSEQQPKRWRAAGPQPSSSSNLRVRMSYREAKGLRPSKRIYRESSFLDSKANEPDTSRHARFSSEEDMSTQNRYIDARLAGIESKLDARMDAMQRFQERAEDRFQRATERHEAGRQQIHQEFKEARKEMSQHAADTRRHATSTAWGTVAGVFGAIAIIAAVFAYWTAEQGSYAKSYGENQVQMQQAVDERAEFREAVKSIQATQQSILERLPQAEPPSQ